MNDIFIVPLSNSDRVCLIDSEDSEKVNQYTWHVDFDKKKPKRIRTNIWNRKRITSGLGFKYNKALSLHRFICPDLKKIDHKNQNIFDNRKINLREATQSQNLANRKANSNKIYSKHKGVYYHSRDKTWDSIIVCNSKRIFIGRFKTELEATKAYNEKATLLFGEFASLNVFI